MPNITKEFTYAIPDEWYTNNFSEGRTGTYTYEGPEYLTIEIDKNTGREAGWCLQSPEELERPVAEDILRLTIDCKDNPFLCEIVNDQGKDSDRDFLAAREWVTKYSAEGYEPVDHPAEFIPRDIYDEFNVTFDFETEEFNVPVRTWELIDKIRPEKITWEIFRLHRNKLLAEADGKIDDGMPAEVRQQWLDYRQKLRDAPTALSHIPPFFAMMMLPAEPETQTGANDELEALMAEAIIFDDEE